MALVGMLKVMRRENLRAYFESSPTVRLLKSDLAPFVIDFLNRTFKQSEVISIGHSDLRAQLLSFQEQIHESDAEVMVGPVDRYLTNWTDAGWLQRFLDSDSNEPQFQLTKHSEEALRFVDSSITRSQSMVGTESRLRLVIETFEDIVRGASADPNRRLEYLRNQRAEIDAEIRDIEEGKSVQVYRPSQIRERFQTAVELLKALQSDFRSVEERFQQIAKEVQQLQTLGNDSRGGILGFALDAEDMLKQQDEGISFFAFVSFILSPDQQAHLRKHIVELQQLAALSDQHDGMLRVRRMVPALVAEADKVTRTTARLSSTLRRLLDARAAADRVRLANVLRDIRQAALRLQGEETENLGMAIEAEMTIASPLSKTFWTPQQDNAIEAPIESAIDLDQAQAMANALTKFQRLDLRKLRRMLREATLEGASQTLAQLVETNPTAFGIIDIIGLIQIAHDDGHEIDMDETESISMRLNRDLLSTIRIAVPLVTFHAKASMRETGTKAR